VVRDDGAFAAVEQIVIDAATHASHVHERQRTPVRVGEELSFSRSCQREIPEGIVCALSIM
jgi:hypothetical protein